MLAPEGCRHVAIPADRLVSGEDFGKLFGAELLPLCGLKIRAQQGGRVIDVMKFADRLAAKDTTLPSIPPRNDIPHQTVCGISLDLLQASLAAVLSLGPPGTFSEAKCRLGEERSRRGFSGGDGDRFRFVGLGTGDQSLSAVLEVGANSGDGAEYEEADSQRNYGKRNEHWDRHKAPPVKQLSTAVAIYRMSAGDELGGALRRRKM
jgi:hypothetical protein